MSTIIVDDRTAKERLTHPCLVIGTDRFMSGWGEAEGGLSYAAWACKAGDEGACMEWVERRRDMTRVRVVYDSPRYPYRPFRACAHLHIYVWKGGKA